MKKSLLLAVSLSLFFVACTKSDAVSTRPATGNPNATVVVDEFADLQCPACKGAYEKITKPILEKYGKDIKFVFKHFPLRSIHRFAMDAAEMSECAADQGKFWEFVDTDYANQEKLSFESLVKWAGDVGIDKTAAERCWKSHKKRNLVLNDYKEGRAKGVEGTPTYFVNGQKVDTGFDTLSAAIEAATKKAVMPL